MVDPRLDTAFEGLHLLVREETVCDVGPIDEELGLYKVMIGRLRPVPNFEVDSSSSDGLVNTLKQNSELLRGIGCVVTFSSSYVIDNTFMPFVKGAAWEEPEDWQNWYHHLSEQQEEQLESQGVTVLRVPADYFFAARAPDIQPSK
jgi:hypothetical protein